MVLEDAVSKLETFVWILSPKSIILGQMINLDMIFHVTVSVYRLANSPQFPVEFRNGLLSSTEAGDTKA